MGSKQASHGLKQGEKMAEASKKNTQKDQAKNQNLSYLRDKDREKVKGIFHNYEIPGGEVSFRFRQYKGDKIELYTLKDNHMHTIPLGVAKHLNNNCWYPVHRYEMDENDKSTTKIGQKVRRFGFQSLEFVDVGEVATNVSEIVTVEKV